MTDQPHSPNPDEATPEEAFHHSVDRHAAGEEKRSIEIVDASPDMRALFEIAMALNDDDLGKLLRLARRVQRGTIGARAHIHSPDE